MHIQLVPLNQRHGVARSLVFVEKRKRPFFGDHLTPSEDSETLTSEKVSSGDAGSEMFSAVHTRYSLLPSGDATRLGSLLFPPPSSSVGLGNIGLVTPGGTIHVHPSFETTRQGFSYFCCVLG